MKKIGLFNRKSKNKDMNNMTLAELQEFFEANGFSVGDINVSGKKSLKEITVFICIKILSDSLSKLPLKIYQDNGEIKKSAKHYLYQLLKLRPNPYMSASDFWKCVEAQRNIHGNSFVWPDISRKGVIKGLYPLDSSKMTIYIDNKGILNGNSLMYYVYRDDEGKEYKLKPEEILHFKGLTTDGIQGLSPVEYLKTTVENAASASQFLNNSYKNGMQTKGIIQYVGELNPSAENTFRESFERMSNGLKNANKVSLLPIGYQYQPISLSMADAQFLENSQFTIRQLTAAYGIKLHQVNDLTKASYATTSEANREFYVDTLMSILTMYEQELTYKLFLDSEIEQGFYVRFNADALLRGDIEKRYRAYSIAIQNMFKTPNEVRALEEDEPMPGGDRLYANGNIIPAEMAGQQYGKGGDTE